MIQILCHLWGDYLLQSDWMASNKTRFTRAAFIHAACYLLPFFLLTRSLPALAVMFFTHAIIDRWRLVRYVVWAKNWLGPDRTMVYDTLVAGGKSETRWWDMERGPTDSDDKRFRRAPIEPLRDCPTGYPPSSPAWMAVWLMIIADNTLHLTINYLALRFL